MRNGDRNRFRRFGPDDRADHRGGEEQTGGGDRQALHPVGIGAVNRMRFIRLGKRVRIGADVVGEGFFGTGCDGTGEKQENENAHRDTGLHTWKENAVDGRTRFSARPEGGASVRLQRRSAALRAGAKPDAVFRRFFRES